MPRKKQFVNMESEERTALWNKLPKSAQSIQLAMRLDAYRDAWRQMIYDESMDVSAWIHPQLDSVDDILAHLDHVDFRIQCDLQFLKQVIIKLLIAENARGKSD